MMERSKYMSTPKVRFHGFKEKWREESLSKLFVERHEISTITESLPQLSFTISEGVIYPNDRKSNKRDFLIKDITNKKFLVTYVGDIIYNPANVIYGAIHRNSLCNGVVSPIYKIFKTEQDSNFMECVVRNPSFISQLSMKTEGTVTKLKTLKPESFLEMIVKIAPSIDEQQKIASYFQSLDSLIQTTSKKLASLKQIKAASLQSMFPQEGETVPKVRFKGFEEEWICVLFEEIAYKTGIKNSENLSLESYSISNELGFIPQNEQFENGGTMSKADKRMYYIVSPKSFAYNPARINVGSLGYYQGERDVIVSSLYEVFKTSDIVDDLFLLYWFKTNIFKRMIEQYQEGGVRLYFFFDKLQKCQIKVPSLQEQQKIASYFCNLDKQISLQTQRLEKLKQIKAACLDKMFV